jgi:hypothetical protein
MYRRQFTPHFTSSHMSDFKGLEWQSAAKVGGVQMIPEEAPAWFQTLGTILAVTSGFFIGLSLVLQKKGLIDTTDDRIATGNEYAYLKSRLR